MLNKKNEIDVEGLADVTLSKFNMLVKATDKANPKPEDLLKLREVFDLIPGIALQMGNFNLTIFNDILEKFAGESVLKRETSTRYIENMKTALGYQTSTFVERLLIDEIAMRWLRLQVMENDHKNLTYEKHFLDEAEHYEKRLDLAQRRYLRAIETLTKVRKLIAQTQAKGAEMFKNLLNK